MAVPVREKYTFTPRVGVPALGDPGLTAPPVGAVGAPAVTGVARDRTQYPLPLGLASMPIAWRPVGSPAAEPKNPASPKLKTPPLVPMSQYPAPDGVAAMPEKRLRRAEDTA